MNKKLIISVVGCGWLGMPLAESLIISGYTIKGSTTSQQKLEILGNKGIDPYLVHFDAENLPDLQQFVDSDMLIVSMPPRSRSVGGPASYRRMAELLTKEAVQHKIKKIILISSTSVFSETNTTLSENDKALPDTDAGKLLLEVENQFLAIENIPVCVLRPAGLVGPDRHPGRFFRNKGQIPNGLAPVNLIHLEDVIGIIRELVDDVKAKGIYHACSLTHPTKQEFYRIASDSVGLETPDFLQEKTAWKVITSVRTREELNYGFKYPDLFDWLKEPDIKRAAI